MTHTLRSAALLLGFVALASTASAQPSDPLVTDGPDFTESPTVVGPRVVQFETGMLLERDDAAGRTAKQLSAPNLHVRLGFNRRLELRAGMQGLLRDHTGRPNAAWRNSASDTEVGIKYQLAHQGGLGLDLAVLASVSVPTGGVASSGNADPFLTLAWGRTLGPASVTGNVNWSAPTSSDAERQRVIEGSLSVGHAIRGSWRAFWEGVVSTVDDSDAATAWTGNAGVTRFFGNNLQVDVHAGRGLNDAAPDWAFGTGVSYRFRRAP